MWDIRLKAAGNLEQCLKRWPSVAGAFDALEARRNSPEYLSLFGNSLSELDDQFFVDI